MLQAVPVLLSLAMGFHLGQEARKLELQSEKHWRKYPILFKKKSNKRIYIYFDAFWTPIDAPLFCAVHTVPVLGGEEFT